MTRILNGYSIYGDGDYQRLMQIEIDLKQTIEKEVMEQAFRASLKKASLFNVRLEWKDNCLNFKKNNSVFSLSEGDTMTIGEDNGGFLFSACVEGKRLTIACAHSLADGVILFPFIRLVLMHYFQLLGVDDFEKQIEHLASKLSGEETGEEMLLEKLQKVIIGDENGEKTFLLSSLGGSNELECKVITLGLDTAKMSTSLISQVAETLREQIDKVNVEGMPISCSLVYDMRMRLKLTKPMHECYSSISISFGEGEFEEKWKHLEAEGKMIENMAKELPIWQKMSSEDMSPELKRRLCNRISRRSRQYQDTFCISSIAFTNKLDRLNNYIECISTGADASSRDMILEMNQLGETICLSITYIEAAERVVCAFIDEMKKKGLIQFEKLIKPRRIELKFPD